MKILSIGLIIIVNLPNQFLMNLKMFLIIMMIFIVPQRRGIPSRFEKITPVRKQELKNTVEVRHTSSTARQGLSDPAAGISTLNGNSNISQSSSESSPQLYHLPKTEDDITCYRKRNSCFKRKWACLYRQAIGCGEDATRHPLYIYKFKR